MIKLIFLILFLIIVLVIFIPFKIQVIMNKDKVNVNLLLFGLINLRIDVDEFVSNHLRDKNQKLSFSKVKVFLKTNYTLKKLIFNILKFTVVDSISYTIFTNMENPQKIVVSNYFYLNLVNYLENNVKLIKAKRFDLYCNEQEDFSLNIIFRSYLFLVIYCMFKYLKLIFKSMKYIKEVKENESSN